MDLNSPRIMQFAHPGHLTLEPKVLEMVQMTEIAFVEETNRKLAAFVRSLCASGIQKWGSEDLGVAAKVHSGIQIDRFASPTIGDIGQYSGAIITNSTNAEVTLSLEEVGRFLEHYPATDELWHWMATWRGALSVVRAAELMTMIHYVTQGGKSLGNLVDISDEAYESLLRSPMREQDGAGEIGDILDLPYCSDDDLRGIRMAHLTMERCQDSVLSRVVRTWFIESSFDDLIECIGLAAVEAMAEKYSQNRVGLKVVTEMGWDNVTRTYRHQFVLRYWEDPKPVYVPRNALSEAVKLGEKCGELLCSSVAQAHFSHIAELTVAAAQSDDE